MSTTYYGMDLEAGISIILQVVAVLSWAPSLHRLD